MHSAVRIAGHLVLVLLLASPAPAGSGGGPRIAQPHVLSITASDFAFLAPDRVPAGLVTIHLRNEGLMPHHAWIVRLTGTRTLRALERELIERGVLPRWAIDVGGPGAVGPGGESRVVLRLEPGRHLILSGERLPDGTTAVMRGMYHPIEVVPAGDGSDTVETTVAEARADATIELGSRAIRIAGALRAGRQRINVVNLTGASQELRIYKLPAGQSERALIAWLSREATLAPAEIVGGVVGLPAGAAARLDLALPSGRYAVVHRPPLLRGDAGPPRARSVTVR